MENTDCIKRVFLVGGAVRDLLLDLPIKDRDYVAVGFNESDFSHLPRVGQAFPVFLQKDGSQIALARKETKTKGGYNGFSTQTNGISLEDDLRRRDLTINSIALDEDSGEYCDPFGGISDLENKILRHTSESFCEDPLRVLRIARFRARFGIMWKIHPSTKVLIYKMREELRFLEKNRVYKEVESVFKSQNSALFFETLFELGVLDVIFPHIYALTTLKEGSLHHLEASVFAHTMEVLRVAESHFKDSNFSTKQMLILKFAALYHDIAKPYCYRNFGNSSGHDRIEYILPLLDIFLPNSIKKPMLIIIQNHIKIYFLQEMRASKIVKFFDTFKRDSALLKLQIVLLRADKIGRVSLREREFCLSAEFSEFLIQTFNALNAYSPKDWLENSAKSGIPKSKNAIKFHILKEKINIVKKNLKSLQNK